MRPILLLTLAFALVAAGCAESADPLADRVPPSPTDAAALFAQAAQDLPDDYGVEMSVTKDAKELMSAQALFDEPRSVAYFTIKMDPALAEQGDGGVGLSFPEEGFSLYTSPEGTAIVMEKNVIVMPPDENSPWMSQTEENDGLEALSDPEALLREMQAQNFTVTSVTPSEVRGKPALKLDGTFTDEDGVHNVTVYVFQEPVRVARVEMIAPADEDPKFAGALMTMDLLYGDEITAEIPEGVKRALGLRYESDRSAFGGFGGSGDEDAPETWTFQVDGGVALADVEAEVHEGMVDDASTPLWTMKLSEGTKSAEGLTLTFADADGDGQVSVGDTLTIERGEGAEGASVALKDSVTGYRVTPGPGALLALLGAAVAVLVARRS